MTTFRWTSVLFCLVWSASYGPELVLVTAALVLVTWLYDECGLSGTWLGKSLCNIGGYTAFEIGATKIMGDITSSLHMYPTQRSL